MVAATRSSSSLACSSALRRVQPCALPAADGPLPAARGLGVGGAAAVLEQAGDVVGVEDAEVLLQAQGLAVFAQQAHAQRVEGADQHLARVAPDQVLGALAHLGGGLVGEGDGGDAVGGQAGVDQAADLVGDHPRFARPCAREHQAGTAQVVHGFLLGEVQTGGRGMWTWGGGMAPGVIRAGSVSSIVALIPSGPRGPGNSRRCRPCAPITAGLTLSTRSRSCRQDKRCSRHGERPGHWLAAGYGCARQTRVVVGRWPRRDPGPNAAVLAAAHSQGAASVLACSPRILQFFQRWPRAVRKPERKRAAVAGRWQSLTRATSREWPGLTGSARQLGEQPVAIAPRSAVPPARVEASPLVAQRAVAQRCGCRTPWKTSPHGGRLDA